LLAPLFPPPLLAGSRSAWLDPKPSPAKSCGAWSLKAGQPGNEITPGTVIDHDGGLWAAVKTIAVKPGKGDAFNQVEPKNLIDARKLNERFGADETVEAIDLELKDFSFLYAQDGALVFMDLESYEQIELATDWIGERAAFL
jgi:elongation factor P